MTAAGGLDLPGEIAGVIALDEIMLHGWALAVATGQEFRPDDGSVARRCVAPAHRRRTPPTGVAPFGTGAAQGRGVR